MSNKPRGLHELKKIIKRLKKKKLRSDITSLFRDAPIVKGKKDVSLGYQAIRENQVADALSDENKAIALNRVIVEGLYEGRVLPSEYIEWLNIYLLDSRPNFCNEKRGRKPLEAAVVIEELETLDLCLREIKDIDGVVNILTEAANKTYWSYSKVKGLYYSEENKAFQDAGIHITI